MKVEKEKKGEILGYFGGLVLDCITTVSGVQSVIAECSLYICVHYILQEKKTHSRVIPPPPVPLLQKQNVTIMQ